VPEVRSPTVRRRELGAVFRALRLERGLTVEQVAQHLLCSATKVSRLETGHRGATLRDVRDLCDLYQIAEPRERDRLMTLAKEAKQQAWWQAYDLPYSTYVGLEAEARVISAFQPLVVPGMLQTADYARAQHWGGMPRLSDDEIERRVEAKLIRQQLLVQPDPPAFHAVLDEAVLHRRVGGPQVMAAQLDKLLESVRMPNITIQIVPFTAGVHPAGESTFNILQLPAPTPGIVFVDGLVGTIYLERTEDLARYHQIFERLQEIALDTEESADLITKIRA
jgi:transcriptional regulator with XRE-family HTH domain